MNVWLLGRHPCGELILALPGLETPVRYLLPFPRGPTGNVFQWALLDQFYMTFFVEAHDG